MPTSRRALSEVAAFFIFRAMRNDGALLRTGALPANIEPLLRKLFEHLQNYDQPCCAAQEEHCAKAEE